MALGPAQFFPTLLSPCEATIVSSCTLFVVPYTALQFYMRDV